MQTHTATNGRVEYDDVGSGRPVVLLHAFPLSRAMWRPQVEALQDLGRLIVPDLRGFGGTAGGDGNSVEQMADDIAALLDALRVAQPVVVAGLSMGGYVALAFARRHAARVRGLILADTRAEADTAEGRTNRDKMIAFARQHSAADVIDAVLPKMVSPETQQRRPEVVAEVRRIASAQSNAGIIAALGALRDRSDATPFLGGISVPTLVIVGSDDEITPPAVAQALASAIPGAKLVTVPGAGHLSNLERPDAFNEAVRSFLQTL
jgi:pimeloyl-ACP methyl ester carboxylesterase